MSELNSQTGTSSATTPSSPQTGSGSQGSNTTSHEQDTRSVFQPWTQKPSAPAPVETPAQAAQPVESVQQTETVTPAQQPVAQPLNPKELAASIVQAQLDVQRQLEQQTQQDRQLTPEEFNQKYGVPTVTADHINALFNAQDPAKAAAVLQQLLHQATRSGALMARELHRQELTPFQEKFQSFEQFQARQQHEVLWNEFAQVHPDLKDERALVEEMVAAAIGKGQKFSDKKQGFDQIAQGARSLIQRLRGGTGTQAPTSGTQTQTAAPVTRPPRQMAPTLTGGRSAASTQGAPANDVQHIFGKSRNPGLVGQR